MPINIKELTLMSKDLKILYVEDNESARMSTLRLLQNFFTKITTAIDGQDGLEKFKAEKIDLIITDINMPNLNGLDMAYKIKQDSPDIPILMISAHNDTQYFLKAIELDIDGFIIKPLIIEQFTKVLYKIVQRINLLVMSENYKKYLENEVKDKNAEIEHKLYFDDLTNLLSRYSFNQDISKSNKPIVILIDIDKFKLINEVYGSAIGSKVLQEFAKSIGISVDDKLCNIYRLSANEFAIVNNKKYIEPDQYKILIDKLIKKLHNLKIIVDDNIITVNITIGVSIVEENNYESAKIALDYAKKYKKPFMIFSSEIDHRKESISILKCRDDISLAINEQRVSAVYQPIVNTQGEIVKHETLMRLKEKDTLKLISPFHFLDVAIKTRLYEELSSTIIFKALHKLSISKHILSINFTYSDIKNSALMQEIEDFLLANKDVGQRAVFEITESESIESYNDVKSFIKRFREYGVEIAIDDFGSDFSNFEYILEIEPDYLKIDGSLVKDIDTDHRAYTLIEAIVQFSHKLGIKVIAEYVHSEVIFNMLKKLDVDEYQGFYFSEPVEMI